MDTDGEKMAETEPGNEKCLNKSKLHWKRGSHHTSQQLLVINYRGANIYCSAITSVVFTFLPKYSDSLKGKGRVMRKRRVLHFFGGHLIPFLILVSQSKRRRRGFS